MLFGGGQYGKRAHTHTVSTSADYSVNEGASLWCLNLHVLFEATLLIQPFARNAAKKGEILWCDIKPVARRKQYANKKVPIL